MLDGRGFDPAQDGEESKMSPVVPDRPKNGCTGKELAEGPAMFQSHLAAGPMPCPEDMGPAGW